MHDAADDGYVLFEFAFFKILSVGFTAVADRYLLMKNTCKPVLSWPTGSTLLTTVHPRLSVPRLSHTKLGSLIFYPTQMFD